MKAKELIIILKRIYKEYVRKHIKKIFLSLILSIVVAGSTSAIAWLLDPAVKKIFLEQDEFLTLVIPFLIILAFSGKGLSLYFARLLIIRVGNEVSAELQRKIAQYILLSDLQTLENRHSGKYISNILYDANQIQNLVSTGVLKV